jgi:hypothetical protein
MSSDMTRIASTLGFTFAELALNRAGKLSSHQSWLAIEDALTAVGFAIAVLGGAMAMIFMVRPRGIARSIGGGLALIGVAILGFLAWKASVGAVKRTALSSEGALSLGGNGRGTSATIGRVSVPIKWEAANVLIPGERYRIYYLSDANSFLSIEPVVVDPKAQDAL